MPGSRCRPGTAPIDCPPAQRLPGLGSKDRL
ncbi:hypothetical protein KP13_31912 [Klebsiella pneumoniae subsp. pneumoniae Kp13]|nr:hypothetical protein KP13_31912 [Klebsiella pneumoniae subsp. pneumoniae Kp13]